jgi:DNA end-binding protein Ku
MPRAIWSGAISFGLVNIPIKLVTAVDRKNVSFREIRRGDHSRIRHRKVAQADGDEVERDDIVKGYEIAPDRYVVIEPDELKSLDAKATKTIEIEDFVDLDEIDPIYYDSSYYLLPGETASKPYKLLHQAMTESGKAGIARFVLRTKQYLAVIRPLEDAIAVSTLVYHDEVVPTERLDGLPDDEVEVSDKELAMARQLIESLSSEWEPERYTDDYRERVIEMIERKAAGEEVVTVPDAEKESGDVVDLMAALEASLQAAKGEGGRKAEAS